MKLNVSMTPWNVRDMAEIHKIAEELGTPMQLATYMFPPVRRSAEMVGKNDRFTPEEAAGAEDSGVEELGVELGLEGTGSVST